MPPRRLVATPKSDSFRSHDQATVALWDNQKAVERLTDQVESVAQEMEALRNMLEEKLDDLLELLKAKS